MSARNFSPGAFLSSNPSDFRVYHIHIKSYLGSNLKLQTSVLPHLYLKYDQSKMSILGTRRGPVIEFISFDFQGGKSTISKHLIFWSTTLKFFAQLTPSENQHFETQKTHEALNFVLFIFVSEKNLRWMNLQAARRIHSQVLGPSNIASGGGWVRPPTTHLDPKQLASMNLEVEQISNSRGTGRSWNMAFSSSSVVSYLVTSSGVFSKKDLGKNFLGNEGSLGISGVAAGDGFWCVLRCWFFAMTRWGSFGGI